jgi:predicted AAA+ superfamily ATPase
LREAGVALPVYNVEAPAAPLELAKQRNLFKLFSNDVGLLASQYADGIQLRILNGDDDINFGAIYENVVAQEFKSHGFKLYYFNSKKQGEVDFVFSIDGDVVPVEVKSGKTYARHNALKNVMESDIYNIKRAYVLCNNNLRVNSNVIYLPIYMAMFIKKSVMPNLTYKVDLEGL